MESKYLTTRMVAEAIGTSASHVRRLIYAGLLRAIRIGKRTWRISRVELERFISSNESPEQGNENE